ncbi:MAG TPA: tetratricopeptide repeat protein [Candidatus Sulfotelmatobacter sp.]
MNRFLLAASLLYCALAIAAQAATFSIVGRVQEPQGAKISGARLTLQTQGGTLIQTTVSGPQGAFKFDSLPAGSYTLRARKEGYEEKTPVSISVETADATNVVLTLIPAPASETGSAALPQFSDEPNFTVAGVTDPTNLGGHGSDTVVRNREALAKAAASLNPQPAKTARSSMPVVTEKTLSAAVVRDPDSYEANFSLGKFLVEKGEAREGIPYLEKARQIKPGDYENEYELALAHCSLANYTVAETEVRSLLAGRDNAELHHLLASIEEASNNSLDAVREYQRAAELDASEPNVFDWGAELLLHQAPMPAIEVFSKGVRLFPASVRMVSGLGAAWYAHGSYDQAVQALCRASDIDPAGATPHIFLGQIQKIEAEANPDIATRLQRFAQLQPENAFASYYYAISLSKQRKTSQDESHLAEIETLLKHAIGLDPQFGDAYLQLGILYSEQKKWDEAISDLKKALEITPDLPDAHYRLAQAYRQSGEKSKAEQELRLYRETSGKTDAQTERARQVLKQFVYTLRDGSAGHQER